MFVPPAQAMHWANGMIQPGALGDASARGAIGARTGVHGRSRMTLYSCSCLDPANQQWSIAFGGPFDGCGTRSLHPRLWIVVTPGQTSEQLVAGDEALGSLLYETMRVSPQHSPMPMIRGCYHRRPDAANRLSYLDLLIGNGTEAQRKYFEMAMFLPLAVMLLRSNDWHTRRADRELAERICAEWCHDAQIVALCNDYLEMIERDDRDDL